ncbi:MAG: carbohydrate ABC transporter permease [Paracoccaceae bacterium]|nr:carbohydrate ABC transporter permease [Paracoccaceae bacterium]MDE3121980.1 carbohydrate ABC transporter permease [Paracoccaceae bacterium]
MLSIGGRKSPLIWAVHLSVLLLVVIWTIPTAGLFITSFRTADQISVSGWWTALSSSERNAVARTPDASNAKEVNGKYVVTGNVLQSGGSVAKFGWSSLHPTQYDVGQVAQLRDGTTLTVAKDGTYQWANDKPFSGTRRIFFTAKTPPSFTLDNYVHVLTANGMLRAFINSLTVAVPATVIPILIAAYAAFALAWMQFPGRSLLIAIVVGLLVVPLQMSLIPLLTLYNAIGHATVVPDSSLMGHVLTISGLGLHSDDGKMIGINPKSYLGIWLAHTGFGLPLAIYLLRNYMVGLPREIIESSRVDGATDFQIFRKIILPLSFPALASFAIFQFLWTWNDLLVATVFLSHQQDSLVMTGKLKDLLGSHGGDWEILAASAFISISVPLLVFFALQKYLVRGLLAGSVK